mgnify:CR=1 FL=1
MSKQNETLATTTVESSLAISKDDIYLFGQGTWLGCAEKLGSHPDIEDGTHGWSLPFGHQRSEA